MIISDPEYWGSNVEDFNPDRFDKTGESVQKLHPFAYIPFSGGKRNCIGRNFALIEARVILAKILVNFKISLNCDPKDCIPFPAVTLRPKNDILVKLTPL
jgi:cytochrome P450